MSDQEDQGILTTAEVADALRVDPRTVRNLISSGELPAYKVGKQYRILAQDLQVYWGSVSTNKKPDDILVVQLGEKKQDDS